MESATTPKPNAITSCRLILTAQTNPRTLSSTALLLARSREGSASSKSNARTVLVPFFSATLRIFSSNDTPNGLNAFQSGTVKSYPYPQPSCDRKLGPPPPPPPPPPPTPRHAPPTPHHT